MELFEGYVGIQVREDQLVNDVMFAILFLVFIAFALVFRFHYRLFIKMIKDVAQVKQRQSLFEVVLGDVKGNQRAFHSFMTFQALFLSSLFFFAYGKNMGYLPTQNIVGILISIALIFLIILLFYFFKLGIYVLVGKVFVDDESFRLWKISYNATIQFWGVFLYLPVLLAIFGDTKPFISLILFVFLYILCRFVIIYKSIRIFHFKKDGLFYLILYLCAQEIIPLFLLIKGSVFLYNFIELSTLWR